MRAKTRFAIHCVRDWMVFGLAFGLAGLVSYQFWKEDVPVYEIIETTVQELEVSPGDFLIVHLTVSHGRQCRTDVIATALNENDEPVFRWPTWRDGFEKPRRETVLPLSLLVPAIPSGDYRLRIRLWSECPDGNVHVVEAPDVSFNVRQAESAL